MKKFSIESLNDNDRAKTYIGSIFENFPNDNMSRNMLRYEHFGFTLGINASNEKLGKLLSFISVYEQNASIRRWIKNIFKDSNGAIHPDYSHAFNYANEFNVRGKGFFTNEYINGSIVNYCGQLCYHIGYSIYANRSVSDLFRKKDS